MDIRPAPVSSQMLLFVEIQPIIASLPWRVMNAHRIKQIQTAVSHSFPLVVSLFGHASPFFICLFSQLFSFVLLYSVSCLLSFLLIFSFFMANYTGSGWCGDTSSCRSGNAIGPSSGSCNAWQWNHTLCATDPCTIYSSCTSCAGGWSCGWCNDTNKCRSGNSSFPDSGSCSNWAWHPSQCGKSITLSLHTWKLENSVCSSVCYPLVL